MMILLYVYCKSLDYNTFSLITQSFFMDHKDSAIMRLVSNNFTQTANVISLNKPQV